MDTGRVAVSSTDWLGLLMFISCGRTTGDYNIRLFYRALLDVPLPIPLASDETCLCLIYGVGASLYVNAISLCGTDAEHKLVNVAVCRLYPLDVGWGKRLRIRSGHLGRTRSQRKSQRDQT